jgi:UDPglucose 6-dehydrogenase
MEAAKALLPNVEMCRDSYEASKGADALVIVTEWNQFRMLDLVRLRELLAQPVVVDLRNIYETVSMQEAGLTYVSVGR